MMRATRLFYGDGTSQSLKGKDTSSTPVEERFPELDEIVERLADQTCKEINTSITDVQSAMPYKAQYVLEHLIDVLKSRV